MKKTSLSKLKKIIFSSITTIFFIIIIFSLGEIILRLLDKKQGIADERALREELIKSEKTEVRIIKFNNLRGIVRMSEDPEIIYELKPGKKWIFQKAITCTNSYGYRDKEFTIEKPENTIRIIGIGDSLMFGWGVEEDKIYMNLLEKELNHLFDNNIEILNFGVPGYNTMQESALFRNRCLKLKPDILLINYCVNDWAPPFFVPTPLKDGIIQKSLVIRLFKDKIGKQESYFRDYQGIDKVIKSLKSISVEARKIKLPVVFFIYPQKLSNEDKEFFKQLTKENGFIYVDMYKKFDEYFRKKGIDGISSFNLSRRDRHPNAEGHKLIAEILKPVIIDLINKNHSYH